MLLIVNGQTKKPTVIKPRVAPPAMQGASRLKDDPAPVKYIDPKYDTTHYAPTNFYISAVVDETGTHDSIGYSFQPKSGKPQQLSLKGGVKEYFTRYANDVIKRDSSLYPAILVVKELSITDERFKNLGDETTMKFKLQVYSVYKNDTVEITHYSGQRLFRTGLGDKKDYDSMLPRTVTLWPHVDNIFKEATETMATFCKGVKVRVHTRSQGASPDSLFYNPQRPLSWDDYRGEAEAPDRMLSYIFINYDADAVYDKGYLVVDVDVSTVFLPKDSWVHGRMEKPETLAHDNYKFRLAYLHMLLLKKEIEGLNLTFDNYKTEIPAAYKKRNKQAQAEVMAYDKETGYGTRKKEQVRWQQTIDDAIAELR
jgi:hypothetical protein